MGNHLDNQHIHLVFLLFFCNGDFLVRLKATREEGLNHTYLTTIDNTEGEADHQKENVENKDHSYSWWLLFGQIDENNDANDDIESTSNDPLPYADNF